MLTRLILSLLLALVLLSASSAAGDAEEYSWQRTHAKVSPKGDLSWAPEPFELEVGRVVRYIDFEEGDDANRGTKDSPWKHHPWDPAAAGQAAQHRGATTYVFKRGVIYRGTLMAKESGTSKEPVRLTSDPDWGEGEASLYGSVLLAGGWKKADADSAPEDMPDPQKVWHIDIGTDFYPRSLWLKDAGGVRRIQLARDPNWTVSDPDDVMSEWYSWRRTRLVEAEVGDRVQGRVWGQDPDHLAGRPADNYVGGTVWTEYTGVMGSPYANRIEAYNPAGAIRFAGPWGAAGRGRMPGANQRYFVENLPSLLDAPGEYYYAAEGEFAGRLFVRLPDDADPNEARLELPRRTVFIDIRDQSHIQISGLAFRFGNTDHWYDRWWSIDDVEPAGVKALGNCRDIHVTHCRFEFLPRAVMFRSIHPGGLMSDITIADNDIRYTDYGAMDIAQGSGREPPVGKLTRVQILRNRLHEIGHRPARARHGHAIRLGFASIAELAGNVLHRTYGAGLFLFGAKGGGQRHVVPLSRVLVHHNKVTYPLLRTNDWGGIETWQSGPFYVFNNVSGNPGGYWHSRHIARKDPEKRGHTSARFGFAYYLDGGFKNYLFNNIAWGQSSDLTSRLTSSVALQEIIGFMNAFFNNTFYRFGAGMRRQAPMAGRAYYLGNIMQDMGEFYIRHAHPRDTPTEANAEDEYAAGDPEAEVYDYPTLAYARNVFHGEPRNFGLFEHIGRVYPTLDAFRETLEQRKALATSVGTVADVPPLADAPRHDFRPAEGSAAIDHGVKFFVPWSLSAVVGEWNFYLHDRFPQQILGENWYMTDEYYHRSMYRFVPLRDLRAVNVTAESYDSGPLEDWVRGALTFNGTDQYCVMTHEEMTADYAFSGGDRQRKLDGSYAGSDRQTLDMDVNSFLIELYFRGEAGDAPCGLVSKAERNGAGYVLSLNERGQPKLRVSDGSDEVIVRAEASVRDGKWHHLLVEVNRPASHVAMYVDGRAVQTDQQGSLTAEASLSNEADFFVGKDPNDRHFAGAIDFLRVARGTLANAETTIEELYAWQFDGPFLRDFTGRKPTGGGRDAGAIEAGAADR